MVFANICVIVLRTKVALALKGLRVSLPSSGNAMMMAQSVERAANPTMVRIVAFLVSAAEGDLKYM